MFSFVRICVLPARMRVYCCLLFIRAGAAVRFVPVRLVVCVCLCVFVVSSWSCPSLFACLFLFLGMLCPVCLPVFAFGVIGCVCVCVHVRACMHACLRRRVCVYAYVCVICVCLFMYVVLAYVRLCACVRMCFVSCVIVRV